jgi:hypothetical protein
MGSNFWISAVAIGALVTWLAFMVLYVAYGNRLRAPAGRAIVTFSFGYALLLVPTILRHPFGLMTANNSAFAWFQGISTLVGMVGAAALIWLTVRANGRWPWQKGDE